MTHWTLRDGRTASVTVELETSETVSADGDLVSIPCCRITTIGRLDGAVVGTGARRLLRPQYAGTIAIVGTCGPLGIQSQEMAAIEAEIAAVEATSEWQAHLIGLAAADAASDEYEAGRERMRRVMGY